MKKEDHLIRSTQATVLALLMEFEAYCKAWDVPQDLAHFTAYVGVKLTEMSRSIK